MTRGQELQGRGGERDKEGEGKKRGTWDGVKKRARAEDKSLLRQTAGQEPGKCHAMREEAYQFGANNSSWRLRNTRK